MPPSFTIVLKRNKEMLYVHLDFENGLTIDALVDSRTYVGAIAQKELHIIKHQAPSNNLKIDDPPNFQFQIANSHLEKAIATATPKFDFGDHIFAEHFVVLKNLTGPNLGLHFMKHNCLVIDTTQGLFHSPHLTVQAKSASGGISAKPQVVLIHNSIVVPTMTAKTVRPLLITYRNGIQHYRDRSEKIDRSRESDNIPFNFNNNWQKESNQSHQHNGITLYDQQEHTNCLLLRSHSGAVQVHQISRRSNSQYDFGRWTGSDYLLVWATQNE